MATSTRARPMQEDASDDEPTVYADCAPASGRARRAAPGVPRVYDAFDEGDARLNATALFGASSRPRTSGGTAVMVGPAGSPELAKAVADAMAVPWPSPAIRVVNSPNAPNAQRAPNAADAPVRWSPSIVEWVVGVVGLLTLAATGVVAYLSLL